MFDWNEDDCRFHFFLIVLAACLNWICDETDDLRRKKKTFFCFPCLIFRKNRILHSVFFVNNYRKKYIDFIFYLRQKFSIFLWNCWFFRWGCPFGFGVQTYAHSSKSWIFLFNSQEAVIVKLTTLRRSRVCSDKKYQAWLQQRNSLVKIWQSGFCCELSQSNCRLCPCACCA